ncbi:hypothetical protein L6452_38851 [Arctium lappa]|uniref:Uncharacterized protein n=1 Tax=Arctium lappa TaxID=4217 RepID=A0ACB8XSE1_ARCLA|nr:hypothetical protein L6452_38851 [Arctium lappa]
MILNQRGRLLVQKYVGCKIMKTKERNGGKQVDQKKEIGFVESRNISNEQYQSEADLVSLLRNSQTAPSAPAVPFTTASTSVTSEEFVGFKYEVMSTFQCMQRSLDSLYVKVYAIQTSCKTQAQGVKRRYDQDDDHNGHKGENVKIQKVNEISGSEEVHVDTNGDDVTHMFKSGAYGEESRRHIVLYIDPTAEPTVENPSNVFDDKETLFLQQLYGAENPEYIQLSPFTSPEPPIVSEVPTQSMPTQAQSVSGSSIPSTFASSSQVGPSTSSQPRVNPTEERHKKSCLKTPFLEESEKKIFAHYKKEFGSLCCSWNVRAIKILQV